MALIVKTNNSLELLKNIEKEMQNGNIVTWKIDNDGDYTYSPEQWCNKAWFHKYSRENEHDIVRFGIIGNQKRKMTSSLYAIYHARFLEMLLSHFDEIIENIQITSNGERPWDVF